MAEYAAVFFGTFVLFCIIGFFFYSKRNQIIIYYLSEKLVLLQEYRCYLKNPLLEVDELAFQTELM